MPNTTEYIFSFSVLLCPYHTFSKKLCLHPFLCWYQCNLMKQKIKMYDNSEEFKISKYWFIIRKQDDKRNGRFIIHFNWILNDTFEFLLDFKASKKTKRSRSKCNKSTDARFLNYNTQQDTRMWHKKQGNTCVKMKRHFRLSLLFGIAILQLPCKYSIFSFLCM